MDNVKYVLLEDLHSLKQSLGYKINQIKKMSDTEVENKIDSIRELILKNCETTIVGYVIK